MIVEEVLMSPGSWDLDCDYDEDLAKALMVLPGPHVLLWWGERLIYCGPVLQATIAKEGIALGGRNLLWWLGPGTDGPVIDDREYLAGNNRLGNPNFELGDLYWKMAEATKWVIGTGGPVNDGSWSAVMTLPAVGGDDVLASFETFETQNGDGWIAFAQIRRVSGDGHIRLRVVVEGQFRPQNLVQNADFSGGAVGWTFTTNSFGTPAAAVVSGQLRLGPIPQRQVLQNPKFDLGLAPWALVTSSNWFLDSNHPFSPAYSASTAGSPLSDFKAMFQISDTMLPGERYRLDCNILPTPAGVDGEAYAAVEYVRSNGQGGFDAVRAETQRVRGTESPGTWRNVSVEFDSDNPQVALVWVFVLDHTNEFWSIDDVYLTRIEGNEVVAESAGFAVTPGLAYDVRATVQSSVNGQNGSVILRLRLSGTGRPDLTVVVSSTEHTQGQPYRIEGSVTPPSGYDVARLQIVGKDILGSYFTIDDVDVRQSDKSVIVKDSVMHSSVAGATWNLRGVGMAPVPAGADRIRLELVAEVGSAWAVDSVSLARIANAGHTIIPTGDIVRELLKHPDTGLPLLDEGAIIGPELLVYDWRIRQLTDLAALQHLSRSGVASPVREYRVHPDGSLDWGTPEEIFADRDQLIFGPKSLLVLDPPDVEITAEGRVETVRVIGAERRKPNGDRTNIEGEASNPAVGVDFFGNPVNRTRVVQDGQVDHPGYAAALARYQADQAALAPDNTRVVISDWSAEQDFDVGDWVYLHKPEAGLEDPDNERTLNGETVFPARRRVIARTLRCGKGPFTAELRMPDGSTLPLAVRWESATSAEIEVGVPRPEFINDPQGGPAGVAFLRWRTHGGH